MTSDPSGPFDRGLQLERTSLSWQRTLLALSVASLAIGRILEPALGAGAVALSGLGLAVSGVLFVVVRRRYRVVHKHLTSVDSTSLPHGAALVALTAGLTLLAGLSALLFVLHEIL